MPSVNNSGTDYVGVQVNTSQGANYNTLLCIMAGTFTGFHRVFTEDIEFNKDEPQKFKDDYVGRIVVSTGKIATDWRTNQDIDDGTDWHILYDKEGITIEDALPMIELSRIKKDKRVFGVLGDPKRTTPPPQPSPQRKRAAAVKESVPDVHTYPIHISNDIQRLIHISTRPSELQCE